MLRDRSIHRKPNQVTWAHFGGLCPDLSVQMMDQVLVGEQVIVGHPKPIMACDTARSGKIQPESFRPHRLIALQDPDLVLTDESSDLVRGDAIG
ncbi:MAG: hypothetical protein ABW003_16365 [Microvirga sp.]